MNVITPFGFIFYNQHSSFYIDISIYVNLVFPFFMIIRTFVSSSSNLKAIPSQTV